MKKFISMILVCGLLTSSAAVFAEDITLTAANSAYSVTVNGGKLDLGENEVFTSGKQTMLPLRATAEKLGFKVTWDGEEQAVKLDNGEVNTRVYIGTDSYYMASSTAIGMSAPTVLGAAPVLKNDVTSVPAELFNILLGAGSVTVSDGNVTINTEKQDENVQIPNPFTEYKTIDEAKKAVSFDAKLPSVLPKGYEASYISTLSDGFLQVTYTNGDNEINYRTAKGNDDISGDYTVYKETKQIKVNDIAVTVREGGTDFEGKASSGAIWTDGGFAYSIYSSKALSEKELAEIIKNVK